MFEYEGKLYARVSDIIRPFCCFGHIDPVVLDNKARIGTEVHKLIADDLDGEFVIPSDETRGYFNSYLRWKKEIKPKFNIFGHIHNEPRCYNSGMLKPQNLETTFINASVVDLSHNINNNGQVFEI